jgi:hypothetical protein
MQGHLAHTIQLCITPLEYSWLCTHTAKFSLEALAVARPYILAVFPFQQPYWYVFIHYIFDVN